MELLDMVLLSYSLDDICELNEIRTRAVLNLMIEEGLVREKDLYELVEEDIDC